MKLADYGWRLGERTISHAVLDQTIQNLLSRGTIPDYGNMFIHNQYLGNYSLNSSLHRKIKCFWMIKVDRMAFNFAFDFSKIESRTFRDVLINCVESL